MATPLLPDCNISSVSAKSKGTKFGAEINATITEVVLSKQKGPKSNIDSRLESFEATSAERRTKAKQILKEHDKLSIKRVHKKAVLTILEQLELPCTPARLEEYTKPLYEMMEVVDKRYLDYDEFLWLYENMVADELGLMEALQRSQKFVGAKKRRQVQRCFEKYAHADNSGTAPKKAFMSLAMDMGTSQYMTREELDRHKDGIAATTVVTQGKVEKDKRADLHEAQRFYRKTLASADKRKALEGEMVRRYKSDLVELSFLSGLS